LIILKYTRRVQLSILKGGDIQISYVFSLHLSNINERENLF